MLLLLLEEGVLLLPWRDTSCGANFPPGGLLLRLTRYTCGGEWILLGHRCAGSELEGRWWCGGGDRPGGCISGRLSNVGSRREVKAGRGICRKRKRLSGVVIVVIVVAARSELEGRCCRLTICSGRSRPKLEHLFRLGFVSRRSGCCTGCTERTTRPESRGGSTEHGCRRGSTRCASEGWRCRTCCRLLTENRSGCASGTGW